MDNPITPSLSELVLAWWKDQWGCAPTDAIIANRAKHDDSAIDETEVALMRAAESISRLMAQGGLVSEEPLRPLGPEVEVLLDELSDSVRGQLAVGFVHGPITRSEWSEYHERVKGIAANLHTLLQRSAATGSPSNPVDDGAVERMRNKLNNLSNAAAIVFSRFEPKDGPGETAKALLKMELGLKDDDATLEAAERHMPMPRMTEKAQRIIEDGWKNDAEAHALLDLIGAEFSTDPMSTQCFDERIVERVRLCVAKRKAFEKQSGCF